MASLFIAGKAPVLTSDDVSSDRSKCRLQRKSAPLETIDFGPLLDSIKTLIVKLLYQSSIPINYNFQNRNTKQVVYTKFGSQISDKSLIEVFDYKFKF